MSMIRRWSKRNEGANVVYRQTFPGLEVEDSPVLGRVCAPAPTLQDE